MRGWWEVTPGKDQGESKWPEAEKASLIDASTASAFGVTKIHQDQKCYRACLLCCLPGAL